MKSRIVILLLAALAAGSAAVYGEDAAVLSAGTLRFDVATDIGFVRKAWDGESRKVDAPDAMIIGAAPGIAYGFADWFTAAFDWSPGVTDTDLTSIDIASDGDGEAEIYEGLSDFSLRAQFQIIGKNTPVVSERFRLRLAPGMVIPFPGISDQDSLGNHAWGAGADASFDALMFDNFFVNLFGEVYWFPVDNQSGTNHDWEFALEAGPHYAVSIGSVGLAFALPISWEMSLGNDESILNGGASSHLLALHPTIELKLTRPLKINMRFEYTLPLYGKNNYAAHTITIKAPVYFNFAKNKGEQ
ncbi:MAG: hypothetical protein LBK66_00340 [Spirochaetaceae bacterium]|jgi:hypothetical protein|nr:hypothetical protein [Spirochaetaceae bacterium]